MIGIMMMMMMLMMMMLMMMTLLLLLMMMMVITARGKEMKRERKVQAVKVVAVTPRTNACRLS